MNALETEQNFNKIKDLLKVDNFDINNTGLELAITLAEPAIFRKLLTDCGVDDKGKLFNKKGDFNNYIICCLLVSVNSPDLKNIRSLDLSSCSLKNVDIISNLTNLTNLNLKFNYGVENLDGLANLTNLTELSIQSDSIKNVDFLAKLTKIKHFYFSGGENIENMDAMVNLINLEWIHIYETPFNLIWYDEEETGDPDDAEVEYIFLSDDQLAVWFSYMFGSKHERAYKGKSIFKDSNEVLEDGSNGEVAGFRHELYPS